MPGSSSAATSGIFGTASLPVATTTFSAWYKPEVVDTRKPSSDRSTEITRTPVRSGTPTKSA
jgi:hypothetical protein